MCSLVVQTNNRSSHYFKLSCLRIFLSFHVILLCEELQDIICLQSTFAFICFPLNVTVIFFPFSSGVSVEWQIMLHCASFSVH